MLWISFANKGIPTMSPSVSSFFLQCPVVRDVTMPYSLSPQFVALWITGSKSTGDIRHALGVDRIMSLGY